MVTAGYHTDDGSFFTDKSDAIKHEQQLHTVKLEDLVRLHWEKEDLSRNERNMIVSFLVDQSDVLAGVLEQITAAKNEYVG